MDRGNEAMSEWVKCSDRMPELGEWVLCSIKSMFTRAPMLVLKAYIYAKDTQYEKMMFKSDDKTWRIEEIERWMPLPPPPKE